MQHTIGSVLTEKGENEMDYCTREIPIEREDELGRQSIKNDVQETFNILSETHEVLNDFSQIVYGKTNEDKTRKDISCLCEEVKMLKALAFENLQILNEIKKTII